MACYNLGDYICESRKQLGITQEELAFGICSTGTLSKIENGFVVPKRKNYEAIMQRLGKTMGICNIHATAEEMELYAYMRQLVHAVEIMIWKAAGNSGRDNRNINKRIN